MLVAGYQKRSLRRGSMPLSDLIDGKGVGSASQPTTCMSPQGSHLLAVACPTFRHHGSGGRVLHATAAAAGWRSHALRAADRGDPALCSQLNAPPGPNFAH
eukprot:366490-Chlamydomonas_euryale.AAC.40